MGIVILIIDIDIINTKIYNRKAASYISACKHVPKPQAIHADLNPLTTLPSEPNPSVKYRPKFLRKCFSILIPSVNPN